MTSLDRSLSRSDTHLSCPEWENSKPLTLDRLNPKSLCQAELTETGVVVLGRSSSGSPQKLTLKQKAHLKAAHYWLSRYEVPVDATPLQKLEPYIEAHDQLFQAGAWSLQEQLLNSSSPALAGKALPETLRTAGATDSSLLSNLLSKPLTINRFKATSASDPEPSWHQMLGDLGYYTELVNVYQKALDGVTDSQRLFCLYRLGYALTRLGQFSEAEAIGQELLTLAQSLDDSWAAIQAWNILGNVAQYQTNYNQALQCYRTQLQLAEALQDLKEQGYAWVGIGSLEGNFNAEKAFQHYLTAYTYLKALEPQTDRFLAMEVWGGLADASFMSGRYTEAIDYATQLLNIATEVSNLFYQYEAYYLLGSSYLNLQQSDRAKVVLEEALNLARNGHYKPGEVRVLNTLGILYSAEKCYSEAIDCFQRALSESNSTQDLTAVVLLHCQLAYCYRCVQATEKAQTHYRQARDWYPHLKDVNLRASALACFAYWHWQEGQFWDVLKNLAHCFWILPPWKSATGQVILHRAKTSILETLPKWFPPGSESNGQNDRSDSRLK